MIQPDRTNLFIGKTSQGEAVHLNYLCSANSHLLILGASGYGKSHAIQVILDELPDSYGRILILDVAGNLSGSSDGSAFLQNLGESLQIRNVVSEGCGINLFTPLFLENEIHENIPQMASRIVDSLHPILGNANMQEVILYKYIKKMMQRKDLAPPSLEFLHKILQTGYELDDKPLTIKLANKLQRIVDGGYLDSCRDESLFTNYNCEIIRLYSIPENIQRILCDVVLWNVWSNTVSSPMLIPTFIVIDEFQNVNVKQDSPLYKILCEGRKYGLNLVLATQTIKKKYPSSVENAILQAGTKFFFRPPEKEARYIAELLSSDKAKIKIYQNWLSSLDRGTAIVKGNLLLSDGVPISTPKKIRLRALSNRTC